MVRFVLGLLIWLALLPLRLAWRGLRLGLLPLRLVLRILLRRRIIRR